MGEAAGADVRRQQGHEPRDAAAAPPFGVAGARRRRPEHGRSLRRRRRLGRGRTSTSPARRRLTVEFWLKWDAVSPTRTRSRWSSPKLQRQRRRLPRRPGRAAARRDVRRRPRALRPPQQRLLRAPERGQWHHYAFVLDTTAPAAAADHAVRRRRAGELPEARQRHGRRAVRERRAELHVARRRLAVRRRRPRRGRGLQPGAERGDDRRPLLRRPARTAVRTPPSRSRRTRPSPDRRSPSTRPRRPTRTARSSTTSGTSTATARYERQGTTATVTQTTPSGGLRRPSSCASPTTRAAPTSSTQTLVVGNAPHRELHRTTPNPAQVGQTVAFNGVGFRGPRRDDREVRVGPRRQRHLRDRHRDHRDTSRVYAHAAAGHGRAAGHRQRRHDRHEDAHRHRPEPATLPERQSSRPRA